MSDFSAFMAGNAQKVGIVKFAVSDRFVEKELNKKGEPIVTGKDKDGEPIYKTKPIEWELKAISSEMDEIIRSECTKKVPTGKRGQTKLELDENKYLGRMCAACVVYPDLKTADLQDSYGADSPDDLLKKILLPAEYTDLRVKVMEINGYDTSMEDLVDEAKN